MKLDYLHHPPSSPDLNPIENIWSTLKRMVGSLLHRPTTLDGLFEAASACWHEIPQKEIDSVVDSMPRRLEAVIAAGGGHIKY